MFNIFRLSWLLLKMMFFGMVGFFGVLLLLHDYYSLSKLSGIIHKYLHWCPQHFYGDTIAERFVSGILITKDQFIESSVKYSLFIAIGSVLFAVSGGWNIILWFIVRLNSRDSLGRESDIYQRIQNNLSIVMQAINHYKRKNLCTNDYKIKYYDTEQSNMWIFPNRTIVITTGFIDKYKADDATIQGVLAHEIGHVINGDLIINALALSSNIVSFLAVVGYGKIKTGLLDKVGNAFKIMERVVTIYKFLLPLGVVFTLLYIAITLTLLFITLPLLVLMITYAIVSVIIIMPLDMVISRTAEFKADVVAADAQFGNGLINFLYDDLNERGQKFGLKAFLTSTHPNSSRRIKKLEEIVNRQLELRNISVGLANNLSNHMNNDDFQLNLIKALGK